MTRVLTIGGGRFMGRFTVEQYLEQGASVTLFTRGETAIPFDTSAIDHVKGDRRNESELREAAEHIDPDVVVDFAAFYPEDVREAMDIFSDVDAYVYVSSTSAYEQAGNIPLREGTTPLRLCSSEQATDDSAESYGARKAEGDRILADASNGGINAISVRPTAVYGPYDPTRRQEYWIDRVRRFDRIVVPGDAYWMPMHLAYVEDVARAIRLVADRGTPGESYNVASRTQCTFTDFIESIAGALETSVTLVRANSQDLATVGLTPAEFSLCKPFPYFVSTEKLAGLGWESTSFETGLANAVDYHLEHEPDGTDHGPDRETETQLLAAFGENVTQVGQL